MAQPSNTLVNLLRLADVKSVRWLTGAERVTENAVNWVATDLSAVQAGDLLVLDAEHLRALSWGRIGGLGLAAILVVGTPPDDAAVGGSDLPVGVVSGSYDRDSLHRRLLTALINQRAHILEREHIVNTRLSQLAAEGAGLDGLAQAMAEISGHGIVVQDKRLRTLASVPSGSLAASWPEILERIKPLESLPESLRDRKRAGKEHTNVRQPLGDGLSRYIVPINVSDVARGYLSVVGADEELDVDARAVVDQGAVVCAVEMSRDKAVRETEKRLHGNLLTALLKEGLSARDALPWAQAMGLDLEQAHVAMRLSWDTDPPPSRRRLETLVNGEVTRLGLTVIVSPMGSEVICICQVPPDQHPPAGALTLGKTILARARQENSAAAVRCGVGSPAADLSRWRSSFRQAGVRDVQAITIGKTALFPRAVCIPIVDANRTQTRTANI